MQCKIDGQVDKSAPVSCWHKDCKFKLGTVLDFQEKHIFLELFLGCRWCLSPSLSWSGVLVAQGTKCHSILFSVEHYPIYKNVWLCLIWKKYVKHIKILLVSVSYSNFKPKFSPIYSPTKYKLIIVSFLYSLIMWHLLIIILHILSYRR